nr:MAG TPA: helix-turn-helix domain protein [Caudoviricetes sp.]
MNNLKMFREKKNIPQSFLAQQLNVSQQAISMWEKGESFPRADKLLLLSKILDCTVDELLKN